MEFPRRTVKRPVSLAGNGLHSGVAVRVTIHPGADGIRFKHGSNWIDAIPENVSSTTRCTSLGEVSTIEHLMAAFGGLEVTDADVEVDAAELPALDGSAGPYVAALVEAGFEDLAPGSFEPLFERIFVQEPTYKLAVGAGTGHWRYEFVTESGWPGVQTLEVAEIAANFPTTIAPARTIAFEDEIEAARAAGLGQGLDIDSVVLIGSSGYANEPRFPDEPARHKLLDAMGDLYLAGVPLAFLNVVGERSGHEANVRAAALLRRKCFMSR
jgi:UDP-3-O-[3-hydroxymyristoyl] N-acetylglucosamine deacetylase